MKQVRLQAHRGVSSEYPENTFAAFRAAIREGYGIIELDHKFTKDNRCVVLHDRTLNRTARDRNGNPPAEELAISDLTLKEAREWDFGLWMGEEFRGEQLPTLEELLEFIKQQSIPFKFDNVWETFTDEQKEIYLDLIKRADLGIKLGFTCRTLENFERVAREFPTAELHWDGNNDEATLEQVAKIAQGRRLTVWVRYENSLSSWFKGNSASVDFCRTVKRYGELGIWIISLEDELVRSVCDFGADAVETTGHVKPGMLKKISE